MPERKKFEYKIYVTAKNHDNEDFKRYETDLVSFGSQGWELVTVTEYVEEMKHGSGTCLRHIFKREKI